MADLAPYAPSTPQTPAGPPLRVGDLVVTIALGLLVLPAAVVLSMLLSGLSAIGSTGCAPGACDWYSGVIAGGLIAAPVVAVVGVGIAILQLVRRRWAWPWVAAAAALAALIGVVVFAMSFVAYS